MAKRYIFKYRDQGGFSEDELNEVLQDPLIDVLEVFMDRALLAESADEPEQIEERFGDKWTVGLETVYPLPEIKKPDG